MTVANTPTGSIMFDDDNPHTASRELVDRLIDDGELEAIKDTVAIETERDDGFSEMVCGWGFSMSLHKPPISASQRANLRRKAPKPQPADIDTSRITVRCISEDYKSDSHRASWKANVEPGTYRYIANNGIYRSTKFSTTHSDWVTAKRSRHSERLTTTPEIRHAQKTLRKELNEHFKHETNKPDPKPQQQKKPEVIHVSTPSALDTIQDVKKETETRPVTQKDPKLVKSTSDLFLENFSSKLTALERELTTAGNEANTPENLSKPGANPHTAATAMNFSKHRRRDISTPDAARFLAQQADDISKDVFTVKPVIRAEQPLKPLEKLTPHHKMLERQSNDSEQTSNASHSAPDSPALSTSFMTAMNAFAQIHHQHHRDGQQCKSTPSTYRSGHRNSSGSYNFSSNNSDTDSLNSVRNALTLTNKDIEKMRMNQIAIKDYSRYVMSNAKISTGSTMTIKPFGGPRRGKVGYRPTAASASNNIKNNEMGSHGKEIRPHSPESMLDSQPSTAPGTIGRSLRESKVNSMSLPEISGKRLSVTSTSHRLL